MSLYKDKIMPVVSDRFAEYKATIPEGEEPRKWWPFCMDEVKKLLEAESDEVKAEVEVKRHAAKTGIDWDVVFNAGDNDDDVPITQAQAQQVQRYVNLIQARSVALLTTCGTTASSTISQRRYKMRWSR